MVVLAILQAHHGGATRDGLLTLHPCGDSNPALRCDEGYHTDLDG